MGNKHYIILDNLLERRQVTTKQSENTLRFSHGAEVLEYTILDENSDPEKSSDLLVLHKDQLIREPEKVAALILSKLKCNQTIFARNCEVKKIDKRIAVEFLNAFHIMKATQSAFNFALFLRKDLVAVVSFSKGRKMNRLHPDQRSYELIRFCCRPGITVTGGLTKLVKNFCEEKKAGDIMTYVDKQLSDGSSFVKAGFKKHSETDPNYFLVDRKNFERTPTGKEESFDATDFYKISNAGNIKLVYTP